MTRRLALAMGMWLWLLGCSDDPNYLYGSIEAEYDLSLDFDEVEIRKEPEQFVLRYRRDYEVTRCHYENKNTVLEVTIQHIPSDAERKTWIDVKDSIGFKRYVLTIPPPSCDVEQQNFPENLTITEASVIFKEVGQKAGESVQGEFRVRFGGATLNGGFQAKMQ